MTLRVGLMVGREWSFPPAFVDEVMPSTGIGASRGRQVGFRVVVAPDEGT